MPQPVLTDFDDEDRVSREIPANSLRRAGNDNRLVLLLDEFDVLDVTQEEQLSPGAAARVFPYLRELMTKEPRLGFVFVVGRRAEELGIEFKATFKASRYQQASRSWTKTRRKNWCASPSTCRIIALD